MTKEKKMEICEREHVKIVFINEQTCPLCDALMKIDNLKEKVYSLEGELNTLLL